MKIGVVTPTHPRRNAWMLNRAVQSVCDQRLPAAGHFIVNDVDGRGAAWTRQQALDANPFPWTAFLDSDDWFRSNHLQVLAQFAEDTGADYVYSWFWLALGEMGQQIIQQDTVFPPTHFTEPWDRDNPRHTTITVLVRTELAKEVGFIAVPDDGEYAHRQGEDWQFTLGCNKLGRIEHIAKRTWYWSHHGLNTSGIPGRGDG